MSKKKKNGQKLKESQESLSDSIIELPHDDDQEGGDEFQTDAEIEKFDVW